METEKVLLRDELRRLGITQCSLAKKFEYSEAMVSMVLSGSRKSERLKMRITELVKDYGYVLQKNEGKQNNGKNSGN